MTALERLTPCFQGLIPAWLCTCSADGMPNVAMLSHVDYVDAKHVALSFQFFNKSRRNIGENPFATLRVYDPDSLQMVQFQVRYVRTETEGPTFESMRLRVEAIASHSGLKGIFKLLGADIYEVLEFALDPHEVGLVAGAGAHPAAGVRFTMRALQEIADQIQRSNCIDTLLDGMLETLERQFGFRHSMILLTGERPDHLELVASRGYPEGGVGSEVGFGEGIIGMVAQARKPLRISGLMRHMLYAYAVASRARTQGIAPQERCVPLPGLASPETQLGIPLLAREELVGVLCIESEEKFRFHEEDRAYAEVLGGYLAIAIQNALLSERVESIGEEPTAAAEAARPAPGRTTLEVEYFGQEDCILVDREYLVRGLPARILHRVLVAHRDEGTTEFTNRRLRLDRSLELPAVRDNLESRLILLRRRLEERCPGIQMVPTGRGRFQLVLGARVDLVERD